MSKGKVRVRSTFSCALGCSMQGRLADKASLFPLQESKFRFISRFMVDWEKGGAREEGANNSESSQTRFEHLDRGTASGGKILSVSILKDTN